MACDVVLVAVVVIVPVVVRLPVDADTDDAEMASRGMARFNADIPADDDALAAADDDETLFERCAVIAVRGRRAFDVGVRLAAPAADDDPRRNGVFERETERRCTIGVSGRFDAAAVAEVVGRLTVVVVDCWDRLP